MPKIAISLDFDGCSDVLFEGARRARLDQLADPAYQAFIPLVNDIIDAAKEVITGTLDGLCDSHEEIPEVFCGSNRQSRWLDNMTKVRGGSPDSALDMLPAYCASKGWVFNKFLLADKYLRQPDGYSIDRPDATSSWDIVNSGEKFYEWDPTKIELLCEQVKRAGLKKPDDIVDFYYIDDDARNRIIPGLKFHFLTHPAALPPNVRLHFIKYDWQILLDDISGLLGKPKEELKVMAKRLMQPQGVIKRCEVAGQAALTREEAFEAPPAREAAHEAAPANEAVHEAAPASEAALETAPADEATLDTAPLLIAKAAQTPDAAPEHISNPLTATAGRITSEDKYEDYSWRKYSLTWNAIKEDPPIIKVKALLINYVDYGWVHWRRHHRDALKVIVARMGSDKQDAITDVKEAIKELNKLYLVANPNGSLARRIRYIAAQTNNTHLLVKQTSQNEKLAMQWFQQTGNDDEKANKILKNFVNHKSFFPLRATDQAFKTAIQQIINQGLSLSEIARKLGEINVNHHPELSQWQTYFESISRLNEPPPEASGPTP